MGKSLLDPIKPQKGAVDILIHFEKVFYYVVQLSKRSQTNFDPPEQLQYGFNKRRKFPKLDQNHLKIISWSGSQWYLVRTDFKTIILIQFQTISFFNEKIIY